MSQIVSKLWGHHIIKAGDNVYFMKEKTLFQCFMKIDLKLEGKIKFILTKDDQKIEKTVPAEEYQSWRSGQIKITPEPA